MTGYSQPFGSDDKIEILIDQVGRLTEVLTTGLQDSRDLITASFQEMRQQMRDEVREMRTDLAEIKQITQRQAQVAEQQAESVAKLVVIVENLMQRIN